MHRPSTPRIPALRRSGLSAAVLVSCLLAACGGGGGASADTALPPTEPEVNLPAVDVSSVAAADPGSTLPAGWQKGAFMQIFVRSYQDSDGDGIGDLKGLTQRLDYLKDLGVTGLWLMPVTRSQDADHGYAVSDYRNIERAYGSLADFDELLREAHARGIGVIIDYVINHSAATNPLFVNSKSASSNAYRDWYLWQGLKPTGWRIYGNDPWRGASGNYYFAPFWDQMPDFNLQNLRVVAWHQDNLRFWLNRGVDGFRFDAVGNLVENGPSQWENQPQNYPLLRDARALMNGFDQRFLVCVGPSDPRGYTSACGSAFAFGHNGNILAAAKGDASRIAAVADYFKTAPAGMSTMLANHDSFAGDRIFNQLNGNLAQYKLAAATYLLQPGTPFIYYGEEIGMQRGSQGGDPGLRTPMSWAGNAGNAGFTTGTPYRSLSGNVTTYNVQAQQADPASLLNFYKAMLALRKAHPALTGGSYEQVRVEGSVMSFQRVLAGQRVVVAINYGGSAGSATVAGLPPGATLPSAYPAGGAELQAGPAGEASVSVPGQSVRVFGLP
jgi:glycosidase